jgi:hypothetical protein
VVAWFVGYHLLVRDFGPYRIIFMNVCVVITDAMVRLLRNFLPISWLVITCCFGILGFIG